jgi:hypothetical protein
MRVFAATLSLVFTTASSAVDPSTLSHKLVVGYQGWQTTPPDGSGQAWEHWSNNREDVPGVGTVHFDAFPALDEYDPAATAPVNLTYANGTAVRLYSPQFPSVVDLHFKWMADYDIDGAFVQRFVQDLSVPAVRATRDRVAVNARAAAEAHGRVFAVEYDLSGVADAAVVQALSADWAHLSRELALPASPAYLHHRGKPAVVVWGLGFNDAGHPATAATAAAVQALFAAAGVTLIGGVPTGWRTRTGDAQPDPAWDAVYAAFAVVHPWLVGRFPDDAGADRELARVIAPDAALCRGRGQDYLPVVWPGFSWSNMGNGPLNQIPRRGGAFLQRQLDNVLNATNGSINMVFGAMFDEVDEGTAMYKIAATKGALPAQGQFVYAGIDGGDVAGDTWLRLLGAAAQTLHLRQRP